MIAVAPIYHYDFELIYNFLNRGGEGNAWREIFVYIGVPGLIVSALLFFSVREERDKKKMLDYFNIPKIKDNITNKFDSVTAKFRK